VRHKNFPQTLKEGILPPQHRSGSARVTHYKLVVAVGGSTTNCSIGIVSLQVVAAVGFLEHASLQVGCSGGIVSLHQVDKRVKPVNLR
jgi:hypothetical protein